MLLNESQSSYNGKPIIVHIRLPVSSGVSDNPGIGDICTETVV
jgi:hypothetical protein